MITERQVPESFSLRQAVIDAGGVLKSGSEGRTAFRWQGHPKAFVLLTEGKLTVHFRTKRRQVPLGAGLDPAGLDRALLLDVRHDRRR